MCRKDNFQILLLFAIEIAVLNVFFQKKDLGPLGVKVAAIVRLFFGHADAVAIC